MSIRDDLKEEALQLKKEIDQYDAETLDEVVTRAYEEDDFEEAEEVLKQAYELYQIVADIGTRGVEVSNQGVDTDFEDDEFPFESGFFVEFHRDFEHSLMRYIGITQEVDEYDQIERMFEEEEISIPSWIDTEDFEAKEFIE